MAATIDAKTKGIWLWCIPHPSSAGRCLALMDTEGLGDPVKASLLERYNVERVERILGRFAV